MLRRKESLPEGIVELAIAARGSSLHVRGARDSDELRARVRRMLQLHVDLRERVGGAFAAGASGEDK